MTVDSLKTAAAYIRVSTDDQLEYSPDAQLVEIKKYAASHGYILPSDYVYIDEGISGKKTARRDAFNRMIGAAKQKPRPFDAILLWKFSRFARNREDSIVYKSMLRKELGIEVISVSEPLTDDKMSIIMEAMIEAMDEYYSINLAEEVKRGMAEKARRGEIQCIASFGYRLENGLLLPHPEEADLVRAIFGRFISGQGLFPIAKWLNDLGVKTHRGNRFENRTIEYILRNPVYIGKLRWNPTGRTRRDFTNKNIILADAKHEPLVSMDTWDAAQKRMSAIKAQWKYHGRPITEHKRWMSGIIRCSECGSVMIFSAPHYWKCNGYARGACKTSQHISDEKLKSMLLTAMEHDANNSVPINYTVIRQSEAGIDEVALLEEQLKHAQIKLDRLRDAYLSGVETLEAYAKSKKLVEAHIADLDAQIVKHRQMESKVETDALMKERICRYIDILKSDAPMEKKHAIAHEIIDRCTFSKANNTLRIFYRFLLPE